jgi:hypothetical protein
MCRQDVNVELINMDTRVLLAISTTRSSQ